MAVTSPTGSLWYFLERLQERRGVVGIGDSNTYGLVGAPGEALARSPAYEINGYFDRLASRLPPGWQVFNEGQPGSGLYQNDGSLAARYDLAPALARAKDAAVCHIMLGTADSRWNRPTAPWHARLEAMIPKLFDAFEFIVLSAPPASAPTSRGDPPEWNELARQYAEVCREKPASRYKLLWGINPQEFLTDAEYEGTVFGIPDPHFNDAGHECLADRLADRLFGGWDA